MKKPTRKRKSALFDPIDIHVGARVKARRQQLGLSQEKLGETVGLSFQQIQKYEKGANRMGASRLYEISKILNVPVSFFFDDMPEEIERTRKTEPLDDPMASREVRELVDAYFAIKNDAARQKLFDLAKTIAKSGNE